MSLREIIEAYTPCCAQEENDRRMMLQYLDMFPDVLLRANETAHFSASAWVVNPTHDRVLMIWHNIYKSWSWPGGHADGEDDLLSVALREVCEETGVQNARAASEDAPGEQRTDQGVAYSYPGRGKAESPSELSGISHEDHGREIRGAECEGCEP